MRYLITSFLGFIVLACTPLAPEGMTTIPKGPFIMGTNMTDSEEVGLGFGQTKPWFEDENPEHTVDLPLFYIDRLEVNNKVFAMFLEKTQSIPPPSWKDETYPLGQDLYPASGINWFQADSYCTWAGKRLPTEAEWEKASRGPDGMKYPWGNNFELGSANILGKGPQPVGSFPQGASFYKVEDMVGNVWEWTSDWYMPYPGNKLPSQNYGKGYKVLRGLSWTEGFGHFTSDESEVIARHEARASYRLYYDPEYSFGDLGFRCAKSR